MRIRNTWRESSCAIALVAACVIPTACGTRDEGSAVGGPGRHYCNNYYFQNDVFPEYDPVYYAVKVYEPSKDEQYFADSFRQAIEAFDVAYGKGEMQMRYLVVVIQDLEAYKSGASGSRLLKTARIVAFKDLFENRNSVEALVQRTPVVPYPPEDDPAQFDGYGAASLVILPHVEERRRQGEHPVVNLAATMPTSRKSERGISGAAGDS